MFQRFIRIWEFLVYSLWLSPLLFALGGAICATGIFVATQNRILDPLPAFWPGFDQTATVRGLLETLLATLVTMTTFALSITMVVLTLAAGSLGPRMIRNFMGDRKTQNALGIFVGSILFLITTLMLIGNLPESAPVPQLSATLGIALFVINILVLILFVHHLGRSIIADEVIQQVGQNLEKTICSACKTLYEPIRNAEKTHVSPFDPSDAPTRSVICVAHSGYVQGIDYENLCSIAKTHDRCIFLTIRPGQHVIKGDIIGCVTHLGSTPHRAPDASIYREDILESVLIGNQRTAMLDIEFALRQLVEIALRALSPGINDPFTAIAVIYRLGRALPQAMEFRYPVGIWRDENDVIRLQASLSDFAGMLSAAFDQIRQAASNKPDILLPMVEVLESLVGLAKTDQQCDALRHHARMIARAAKCDIVEDHDRKAVLRAATRVLKHREVAQEE